MHFGIFSDISQHITSNSIISLRMSKNWKNGRKQCEHYFPDITVHDFANSKPGQHSGLRPKKNNRSGIDKKEVSKMSEEVSNEDVSWFDKNLEDFDITEGDEIDEEDVTEDPEKENLQKPVRRMKRPHSKESFGVVYPIDLWCQVSKYIYPESVGTFALLCRSTHSVINTVQFWKTLHMRFYIETASLPDHLKSSSLECIHGLRSRVIQMLNYVYPPFIARIVTNVPFEDKPHCLVGQRCILTWHKKVKNVWKFYFKFSKSDKIDLSSNKQRRITSRYFEKWHQDLYYNPESGCSVLEATSQVFVCLPVVMGLVLNRVYLNVSSASMLHQKLKLVLDTNFRTATAKNEHSMRELVIDPVVEARVYPWWDPKYQASHSSIES